MIKPQLYLEWESISGPHPEWYYITWSWWFFRIWEGYKIHNYIFCIINDPQGLDMVKEDNRGLNPKWRYFRALVVYLWEKNAWALSPTHHFLGSIFMSNTYTITTQTLSRKFMASRFDMAAIRRFFILWMTYKDLNMEGRITTP